MPSAPAIPGTYLVSLPARRPAAVSLCRRRRGARDARVAAVSSQYRPGLLPAGGRKVGLVRQLVAAAADPPPPAWRQREVVSGLSLSQCIYEEGGGRTLTAATGGQWVKQLRRLYDTADVEVELQCKR